MGPSSPLVRRRTVLAAIFLLSAGVPGGEAWGEEGHSMICKIAEANLTAKARTAVSRLLPAWAGGDMAAVCSWADQDDARLRYPCAGGLHFANTPDDRCDFNYLRDCGNGACVVGGIHKYASALQVNYTVLPPENLTDSFMFLVHFMGDIHQPLHVGHRGDKGGNAIKVRWLTNTGRPVRLHQVWDTRIIRSALDKFFRNDQDAMIRRIRETYIDNQIISVTSTHVYASESSEQACDYAYVDENNATIARNAALTDAYFNTRLPVVMKRIAEGGVRLAAMLNSIFLVTKRQGYEHADDV